MLARISPDRLAALCARHPWRVIGCWLIAFVVAGVLSAGLSDRLATDWAFTSSPESVEGQRLLEERLLGGPEPVRELVIARSETVTVDDAAFRSGVEALTAELRAADRLVAGVTNVYELPPDAPEAAALVSADRRTTLLPVTLRGSLAEAQSRDRDWVWLVEATRARAGGLEVLTIGRVSVGAQYTELSESDLVRGELFAIPIAMLVLLLVFRAVVAAAIPLGLALVSIAVALGLTALIARGWELSVFVTNMITMIGLAVGIDYSLFIVERYREERRRGAGIEAAIVAAGSTASRAVTFSGLTVVLALVGLLLIPTTIFRSLGLGAILVTVVAVVAVLTLVPAVLRLLGDRIEWPRRHARAASAPDAGRGFWERTARVVMRHPVVSVIASAGLLAALSIPFFSLERSQTGVETFPASDVRTAYEILDRDFAAGLFSPVEIVVDAPRDAASEAAIAELSARIADDPRVMPPVGLRWNEAGDLALLSAPLRSAPEDPASYDVVRWLRADAIPAAFAGVDGTVLVTGQSARNTDFISGVDDWTPLIFGFVLGLSFLLLLLAFRSIVVPLKALAMNLLSVGAAYGLLVLVFQKGYGAELLGFQPMPAIESWIPIFLFCVLFGLSMDYHVFLLSRVQEQFRLTRRNTDSVAFGMQATSRIITGAALIMVVVFSGFAMGEMVMFQQMGFGLAVAILLDATVVRSVLVPASMALLGELNWYLPRWLRWLPDLRVEGARPTAAEPVVEVAAPVSAAD